MAFEKVNFFLDYFKYLDNPIEALSFKFGRRNKIDLKFKNSNESITIHKIHIFNELMGKLPMVEKNKFPEFLKTIKQMDNDEKLITINGISYLNLWNEEYLKKDPEIHKKVCIFEYFTDDEWNMINFNNRNVIDIGSNIGDTPLYFAKMGANVIGFEPVRELNELGLKNLELNKGYSDNVKLVNKAVGGKKGKLNINSSFAERWANEDSSYEIEVITIQDVLNEYGITPDILKMDCEGCEFEIILNNDLTMFNDIIFEYHSYITGIDYDRLVKRLEEQNFKIDIYDVGATSRSLDEIGIIHAHK